MGDGEGRVSVELTGKWFLFEWEVSLVRKVVVSGLLTGT